MTASRTASSRTSKRWTKLLLFAFVFFILLSLTEAKKKPQNNTSGPTNSTKPRGQSLQYDNNCMGCIINGYRFCNDFMTCLDFNGTCPRGLSFVKATGCPVLGQCDGFGFKGIGYIGADDNLPITNASLPLEGTYTVKAPMNRPCYISLVNNQQKRLAVSLQGHDLKAYMLKLDFPINNSAYIDMSVGGLYNIEKTDDIAYVYLGSIINSNVTT